MLYRDRILIMFVHKKNTHPASVSIFLDFCDASYECRQPCPSGFDAECPSGYRCFPNTPCNANYVPRSANMLDFGLPQNAQTLFRTYSTTTSSTNNAACSAGAALSLVCLWITSVMFTSSGHRPSIIEISSRMTAEVKM